MPDAKDRVVEVARVLVVALGAVTFGLFAYVVVMRFRYPIDGEWMVGAVRQAVARLVKGEPMYVAPSDGFIPFVYPPLYHWVCAVFARFMSVFAACKVVSLLSTGVLAWTIWTIAQKLGASRYWSLVGVLLHFGAFSMTLMFYDLERVDAFAAAVVALALVLLVTGEDHPRTIGAGVLLGLAFFAKQPHVLSLAATCGALFLAGQRRRAITIAAVGGVALIAVLAYLEVTTHGWFRYYCVTLPGKHGIEPKVVSTFFIVDWPKGFAIAAASLAMGIPLVVSLLRTRKTPEGWTWQHTLVAAVVFTTMVEAFMLRAHRGGWSNVIIAWTPFGCMAAAIVASKLEERARGTEASRIVTLLLLAGAGFQLLGGIFDPGDAAPNADDWAERQRFVAAVRDLEKQGDVIVSINSDVTAHEHFQMAALYDLLRGGIRLPDDFALGLRERKYAAIVLGGTHEFECDAAACKEAVRTVSENYFAAARRVEREHNGMSGYDARPRWIMRPRKHPLREMTNEALEHRVHVEIGLAEANAAALPPDTEPVPDDSIELRAALR